MPGSLIGYRPTWRSQALAFVASSVLVIGLCTLAFLIGTAPTF